MATPEEEQRTREYVMALRAACNKILYARTGDPQRLRLAIVDAMLQFLAAHEHYTCATVGTARILKPLLLAAVEHMDETGNDFTQALAESVEKRHNLSPTRRERGFGYVPRGERT